MNGDDELEEARRRWGDHVEAVYTLPPLREGATCPIAFGDVVHLREGRVGLVRVPDQGGGLCEILELEGAPSAYEFPENPKPIMMTWSRVLRVLASHRDLPDEVKAALAPYRKCIVLGGMHWDTGVELFDEEERNLLRSGNWSEFNIGAGRLVEALFGAYSDADASAATGRHRVFVHTDDDWNTSECFGPMSRTDAEELIAGLPDRYACPREIRRGVYEVGPDTMTKWELYLGYEKLRDRHFCRGQGE